ncbi:MAG: glycosyltransferase [Lachnospiraceae bacterium]|nr:glycosyltransferase [Lachnospiraceae bacterium]
MIRVLQVLGSTTLGGAESRVMDLYRHMDRNRIQFDFLVTKGHTGYFDEEIESLGGHVYTVMPYRIYNHFKYVSEVKKFFDEHNDYAAVHGHMTSTASIYLPIAKASGIPLTIAHARSAGVDSGIKGTLTNILRKNLSKRCDRMFACSDLAAASVFGEESYSHNMVKIMPNAIEVSEFAVNDEQRELIRNKYNIGDRFVIGHTGRLHEAKNHRFLINVFAAFFDVRPDSVLMIVGDGPLQQQIEQQIDEIDSLRVKRGDPPLKDKIILTGRQSPIMPFYQAFDALVFPSLYEGMPGTVVEAQACGLKCLVSDTVTRLVKTTELVEFESLEKGEDAWAKKLYSIFGNTAPDTLWQDRKKDNGYIQQLMKESDYDVNNQVAYYEHLYEKKSN